MTARLIPASALTSTPVSWLWSDRIPLGAITELIGGPGQAKSSIAYDLAARVTTARPMPACSGSAAPANVILLQAEDHPASRVVPALKAAGADLQRVHLFDRSREGGQPLLFPDDMGVIESAVTDLKARLLVLDPVASYINGNLQSEQSVRKSLMPFLTLADKHNCAVLVVRHLRKTGGRDPIHLGAGSIAFVALARSSLLVGNDPASENPHRHVLTLSKSNLGSAPSLAYRTVQRPDGTISVEWLGETETIAKDIALTTGSATEASAFHEAGYVLFSLLCDGPLPANEVCAARHASQGRKSNAVSGESCPRRQIHQTGHRQRLPVVLAIAQRRPNVPCIQESRLGLSYGSALPRCPRTAGSRPFCGLSGSWQPTPRRQRRPAAPIVNPTAAPHYGADTRKLFPSTICLEHQR